MGRPRKSVVRENLKKLLFHFGSLTAYQAHRHYVTLFAATSRRNIYYQLHAGVDMGLFEIDTVTDEVGEYSWGSSARKVYYSLHSSAIVTPDNRIQQYVNAQKN